MPCHTRTRFAPSPTGYLHRGHVWSALQVWASALATKAKVHLRIEDHDQSRCREEHVDAIRSDLEWMGFHWDSESRQSQRSELYTEALRRLEARAEVYACACTRQQIAAQGIPSAESGETIYSGHCRNLRLPRDNNACLRLRLPDLARVDWRDLRLGAFRHDLALQCGDPMLKDRQGQWTYQFAVVVDDMDEGIDLVVRGEDLLYSTARQIYLAQMLGRFQPPAWMHHSLLFDASGKKLSKREKAASIRAERLQGMSVEVLLGEVCQAAGLLGSKRALPLEEALFLVGKSLPPF